MKKCLPEADTTIQKIKIPLSPFPKLEHLPFECAMLFNSLPNEKVKVDFSVISFYHF